VVVVQILDPLEQSFELEGPVRLSSSETGTFVETNASLARADYLQRMRDLQAGFRAALGAHAGALVTCSSGDDAVDVVRSVLRALGGLAR
jgi:hypothetical protein